jgi:antitoxin HicB
MSKHLGSTLEALFEETGERQDVDALTLKMVLADDLKRLAKAKHVTRSELARRMGTSRMSIQRLFDPNESGFTGETLAKVASALGVEVRIVFEERTPARPRPRRARSVTA